MAISNIAVAGLGTRLRLPCSAQALLGTVSIPPETSGTCPASCRPDLPPLPFPASPWGICPAVPGTQRLPLQRADPALHRWHCFRHYSCLRDLQRPCLQCADPSRLNDPEYCWRWAGTQRLPEACRPARYHCRYAVPEALCPCSVFDPHLR
jgi:hypothetical protein